MSMDECPRCKRFVFSFDQFCQCKLFKIIDHEDDDEEIMQYGESEDSAAEAYAKAINENCDYVLMDTSRLITVGGKRFSIGAEADIRYSINELDSE
ncbi:MAG: hypothetical protein JKY89_05995 [Immundisolibacteraceae bacterium]|nr:hypothetical protein [Immundisolibacteraceae bacterium]